MAAAAVAGEVPRSGPLADAQVEVLSPRANGAGNTPHWFREEAFLEPDFDADTFIADLRRYVPLETLSSELDNHLTTLKHKLVEVINEDYADFVSLSTQLVNVDGAVARMQKPLGDLKERLGAVAGAVAAELEALQGGLQRRAEVAAARAMLDLMQDTAHVMSKVEKLLDEVEAASPNAGSGSGADLDARVRLYERVASKVSRLQFYAARGSGLPFVVMLQPRMDAATAALEARLGEGLSAALAARRASAVGHALHAYSSVCGGAAAQAVVRRTVVAPLVAEALRGAGVGGPRAGPEALPKVLQAVAVAVRGQMGELLAAVSAPSSGLHGFDFLGGSLMPEVDAAVGRSLPGAFSPGVPSTFLANYAAAVSFLEGLEAEHVRTRRQLDSFRGAPAVATFLKRWNLSVYFSLRFQEIAAALDSVVAAGGLEAAVAQQQQSEMGGPPVRLQASAVLAASLRRCLAADVFLAPLADKFVRLALQLVARYAGWLAAGLAARSGQPTESADEGASWGAQATPEQLALVRGDVDALSAWLGGAYDAELTAALAFLPPEARQAAAGAWRQAVGSVAARSAALGNAVVESLAERCSAGLKHVRGISTTYRMVARPAPTRPSHYVPGIVAPLSAFLEHDSAAALGEEARAAICQGSIVAVCRRFQSVAGDLLETVRKTESSLKRLKKNRAAGDAATPEAAGGASDTDKMTTQLFLDVQEFGRQVFKFDIDPSELPAYREVWATVAPAGQSQVDAALLLG